MSSLSPQKMAESRKGLATEPRIRIPEHPKWPALTDAQNDEL